MFNIFSKYGSPGDSISVEVIMSKNNNVYPTWTWTTVIKDTDGKDVSVADLIAKYNTLLEENKNLKEVLNSIEEDGTHEHNEAVKLRQENALLKVEIENWKKGVITWKTQYDQEVARCTKLENEILEYKNDNTRWTLLYQEVVDKNNEILKEVNSLKHLKEENVRVYETMNTQTETMGKLMERIDKMEKENDVLLNKSDLTYKDAQVQIVHDDFIACAKERDDFKQQLDAANKEVETLKRWKKEQLTVQSWWDKIDSFVRDHDDAPLGGFVANTCLNFLKERDLLKAEVKKFKEVQSCNKQNEKFYECNHCKYKVAHNNNQLGVCGCCKDGLMIEKEEELLQTYFQPAQDDAYYQDAYTQKHPMYPLHWGSYDGAASAYPEQYLIWLNEQRDKAIVEKTTTENLEERFNSEKDILDYFNVKVATTTIGKQEEKWKCPCNKCKAVREGTSEKTWEEAASDLALRVVKLEKKVEELTLINIQAATRKK